MATIGGWIVHTVPGKLTIATDPIGEGVTLTLSYFRADLS